MKTPDKLYEFHVANLRAVETALDRIALSMRDAVSRDDHKSIDTNTRVYALLLGAWAECRLAKLLYEPNAFTTADRATIQDETTHLARWQKVVDTAFRKHYSVPKATLSKTTLPHSAFARLQTLSDLLKDDLRSIITLRNKLAHGQWIYPINDAADDIAQEQMDALRTENAQSLQLKRRLLDYLLRGVYDLALSKPAFERDFDSHYRALEQTRVNLRTRDYDSYRQRMQAKLKRGRQKRATQIP